MNEHSRTAPLTLLICALGGEGGGVLTEWLVEAARAAGYPAQATSIPGVAQRTGATTYYLEVFPVPFAELGGKRPVFSLNPVAGQLDAIISSELLETARQLSNGMASPTRTLVISSTARTFTTAERMQLGDGRTNDEDLLALVNANGKSTKLLDMAAIAKQHGTVVSAVMLGAIAGCGVFPFTRAHYESVVQGRSAQASLAGFAQAFAQVQQIAPAATSAQPRTEDDASIPIAIPASIANNFPAPLHRMISLGYARLCEYQNTAYANTYLTHMHQVVALEEQADPQHQHAYACSNEMARWLALWMAFDDIVRVADLKSRRSRWERVRAEVKPDEADLLKVYDHFKPGAAEFAALLPITLATRVLAWDRARVARGKTPWALPLKVGSHSVRGMLALRTLANLKWLRSKTSRFQFEQTVIQRWLNGVTSGLKRDWALGFELAACGRLIKGYGATNERGKENLLHVLEHLAPMADPKRAALAIAEARQAALADEAGKALDLSLQKHGAPARPMKEQTIRFVRKPKAIPSA
jgi:indolepyruvate ferredoxin oxidoreductase, beta subunit